MSHAKAGVMLAAYLKILSYAFFVIPGMISRVLYPDEVACADADKCVEVCENPSGCYDIAYPLLVLRNLPQGVRGIMMAALLSALVSSLTSIFNSSSTVMTMDLWPLCRPKASQRELMVVGRIWILILVIISILWLPALQALKGSQFWAYSQAVFSFLVPPIVATFLLGILWKRTTEQGAFWGMIAGFVVGIIRMCLEWSRTSPPCGSSEESNAFVIVSEVHFLHFAIILAAVTSLVIVVISILTAPRPEAKLRRVTWWTRHSGELPDISDDSDDDDAYINHHKDIYDGQNVSRAKYLSLKWCCGVDLKERKQRMTKEERRELQMAATNIKQDPFWKKVIDANGLLCCACCCFLHAFWF